MEDKKSYVFTFVVENITRERAEEIGEFYMDSDVTGAYIGGDRIHYLGMNEVDESEDDFEDADEEYMDHVRASGWIDDPDWEDDDGEAETVESV